MTIDDENPNMNFSEGDTSSNPPTFHELKALPKTISFRDGQDPELYIGFATTTRSGLSRRSKI